MSEPTTLDAGALEAALLAASEHHSGNAEEGRLVVEAAIRAFLETLAGHGTMVLTTLEQLQAEKQQCFDEGKAAARPAPAVEAGEDIRQWCEDQYERQKADGTIDRLRERFEKVGAITPTPQASAVEALDEAWWRCEVESRSELIKKLMADITAARLAEAEEILAMVDALEYRQPGKTMLQTAADQIRARIAALKAATP